MNCPKCGADISDTFQEAEPDVGIMSAGYFCDACNEGFVAEDREPLDDDVPLFGTGNTEPSLSGKCQFCGTWLEAGYGLAGGSGIGPYMFCPAPHCGKTLIKSKDPEMENPK